VNSTFSAGKNTSIPKALPVRRWQKVQWHTIASRGNPRTWYRTSRQRQPPSCKSLIAPPEVWKYQHYTLSVWHAMRSCTDRRSAYPPRLSVIADIASCRSSAMCGRLRVGKDFLHVAGWSVRPCVRPFGAVRMTAGHNALRGSGPGQKPAFEMHWHWWVVLIAGSTGSALRAVRPPNLHITPGLDAISTTPPRVRRVACSVRPSPSWPTPSLQSCWRARSQQPWSACAPTVRRARADFCCRASWHSG